MTSIRQILRYARKLGQISENGMKVANRSVRYASTQAQQKIVEDENGKKIFPSPYGEFTPTEMLTHEFIWKNIEIYADKIALECAVTGRKYTYSEARDATNYIARSLINMGLRKSDVVALITPNYPEAILSAIGILEADLIATTVNPNYTSNEIKRQLQSADAKAVITVVEIAQIVLEATRDTPASGAPFVVIEDGSGPIPEGTVPFKDLITRGKTLPSITRYHSSPEDVAILPFSSGTTGMPKGVMLTHNNLVANMQMVDYTCKNLLWKTTTADFQEVLPVILPFFHIFGFNGLVLPRLACGTKLITIPKFSPELFIDVLTKHRVTGLFIVPPILLFFNVSTFLKKQNFENMHHFITGAAPLSNTDVENFYRKYQLNNDQLKICQGFGMTETSPVVSLDVSGTKPGSIGRNIAGCELRLVDPVTKEDITDQGQTGEIWVRGPHIMKGYLNNESATREMIVENGWLRTGDIAYYNEEFYFFVTDRLKELIKVKGFQVPPAELEAVLRTHPDVQEAAVIGLPDERCGEIPKAFVVVKKGSKVSEGDIKEFVKDKVSEYKQLQGGVTFVKDIPKNASGKILRAKLKSDYVK
ncbi:4-coumarate--CoA ligase 1-like [Frieseomelitta varia]|uniref:4-coumarate--CoA ligase 1-like n=1 Tax=Frieseomelitta varia TaxID=561572 RepID=UPI001CB69BAF|nr:4-coumarate--CoA ligase 1-like [Frieseomelitta varia]XP_043523650.1 4-coumarate--CoA ligase 1-like [Frieseomelitta varia]XP_043523651.1 4-coumarate--CoA ligase 1-like [Frieseomelitta varia]